MVFTSQKLSLLARIRFCINNLFPEDKVTVATQKKRRFLKEISAGQKICSTSSNKDILFKLAFRWTESLVLLLGKNER